MKTLKINNMSKQQKYNRLKSILENKENRFEHLNSLRIMVNNFRNEFKTSVLSDSLNTKFSELESKLLKK